MPKILLIDDDLDLSFLTERALKSCGYEVLVAHEAMGGIKMAVEHKPDLILIDVMMPGISGPEAVQKLSVNPDLSKIPVIFLTALVLTDEKDLMNKGIKIAGKNYTAMGKPYEIDDLLRLVKRTLSGSVNV